MWQISNHMVNEPCLDWDQCVIESVRSLHDDMFNLFVEHCSPVSVSPYTSTIRRSSLQKKEKGQPLHCSAGSGDDLKVYIAFR